jgi:hypothetical protein
VVTTDEMWPRDEEHRFRLYAARGEVLRIVAASPDLEGVGSAFARLVAEEEFEAEDSVGVMDSLAHPVERRGTWLVNPFASRR